MSAADCLLDGGGAGEREVCSGDCWRHLPLLRAAGAGWRCWPGVDLPGNGRALLLLVLGATSWRTPGSKPYGAGRAGLPTQPGGDGAAGRRRALAITPRWSLGEYPTVLPPNTATAVGLHDVNGYDCSTDRL